ncbi:MAG: DUF1549 domain-containing protein, partial [Pirellulaceae bacterium]
MKTLVSLLSIVLLMAIPLLAAAADKATGSVNFAQDILPILSNKCFVCHGPSVSDPDQLRLDTEQTATADRGGYRAIDHARPAKSALLERITSKAEPMPPADAEKQLTTAERELLSRWIREGGNYTTHWAFVGPRLQPPRSRPAAERHEMIDAFIKDGLQEAGIDFAPEANRPTLARRVALVLTGLPPALEQLQQFLDDKRPDAYERYVDSLLASPRYGEHQARYWLDAVRYGDTHGLHLDNRRGIYPYRDWVVDAFNKNLPLDQFITWQLAGDLLPDPTLGQLVATGFVRMNPSTAEGGAIPAEFQAKNNFDRTETLGTVLLGMTLTCARCHSHKYDPVSQTEYYQLLAFFNSTAEHSMDGNSYTYKPILKAPQDQAAWTQWNQLESQRGQLITEAQALVNGDLELPAPLASKWQQNNSKARLTLLADPKGPFATTAVHAKAVTLAGQIAAAEKGFTTTLVAQDLPK